MRVFITGASGFIGGHVAEVLSRDHEVLALSRSAHGAESARERGATPVMGSLGAVAVKDLEGVDAIVHCAAFVSEWGTREEFWAANVAGTRQLIEAAQRAGVKRFVHVSTEAVLFAGQDLIDVDETHPYPERQRFLYSETKAEAERLVLAANGPNFTTIAVRPRFVWGPRDQTVLPTLLRMAQDGRFVWIDGGRARTSTTHVANLVHAVKLALAHDKGGQAYFVADARNHPALAAPLVEATTARSAVFEPILRDGNVAGVLIVIWQRPLAKLPEAAEVWRSWRAGLATIASETKRAEQEAFSRFRRDLESLKT